MEKDNVIQFPRKNEASNDLEAFWLDQLAVAERQVEYAQKMLGLIATRETDPPTTIPG